MNGCHHLALEVEMLELRYISFRYANLVSSFGSGEVIVSVNLRLVSTVGGKESCLKILPSLVTAFFFVRFGGIITGYDVYSMENCREKSLL